VRNADGKIEERNEEDRYQIYYDPYGWMRPADDYDFQTLAQNIASTWHGRVTGFDESYQESILNGKNYDVEQFLPDVAALFK
jgi:hypothetical protein